MSRLTAFFLTLALSASTLAFADSGGTPVPKAPAIDARSYILVDFQSGRVLAEQLADERVEPASITKVMTVYVAFDQIRQGRIHLDDNVAISERAWRQGIDSTESRMFLEVGQSVKLADLLRGIIIQSGNDAAIAVAEHIGGTEEAFAEIMNHYAQQLGMKSTRYHDASGMPDPEHYTTARDITILSRALIRNFPELYKIFGEREYTWQPPRSKPIRQFNRNGLLTRDSTVDGIKTGHTQSAGYCLATSAKRNDMRLISVVMGAPSIKAREAASAALLNYGYTFYETVKMRTGGQQVMKPRVYKSEAEFADVGVARELFLTVRRGEAGKLQTITRVDEPLVAPLAAGAKVGEMTIKSGNETVASVPLVTLKAVPEGGLWTRAVDSVALWLH